MLLHPDNEGLCPAQAEPRIERAEDVEDAAAAASSLPAFLASRGLHVDRVHTIEPSLEDVFVALVRREGGAVVG